MRNIGETYSLAPMQQGMLFHYLSAPESGVDLEQIVCRLCEQLDERALRQAWEQVVARHTVFRTGFRWEGLDEPVQDVHTAVDLPWQSEDWRTFDEPTRMERLTGFLKSDRTGGFRLDEAPLMRVTLIRWGEKEYRLVWTFSHIILDGRSFPIVLKEVFAIYEANCTGKPLELDAPRPYRDHVSWLQAQDFSKAESFWRMRLAGITNATPLPESKSRGEHGGTGGEHAERQARLSGAVTARLTNLAEENGLTVNAFVQGAWGLLLSRYCGDEDVVFGATRACRRSGVEGASSMLGLFINTLPVRLRITPELAVVGWLKQLRADERAVWPYEHTPLINVQSWSDVPAGTPLFESIIVFDNFLLDTVLREQGGAWLNRNFELHEKAPFALTLYGNLERELLLKIAYDQGRFDDATIARMLGHLATILEQMSLYPDRPVGALSMLTDAERRTMMYDWNATEVAYPRDRCIHQLIEAQVERRPEATAAVYDGQTVSYAELNARANVLAHRLRRLGVGPDKLVGVYLDRSLDMLVAVLGILKAGGAYVPLDPAYPRDRLAFMCADARLAVVLTQTSLSSELPHEGATVVCVDQPDGESGEKDRANPAGAVSPDNLAYVIYTSGSTGKPKGVMVEHRNVVNFFAGMDGRIEHDPPGVWLAVTSLSFDISVLELFWTLARGFKVVLAPEQHRPASAASPGGAATRPMAFSLFYFASDEGERAADKYKLLIEGAKFADRNGFVAVSTPERHFHAFGGLYPNPAVASAAVASVTERVQIRAGSVVLPLHHPIRIAEEWALVDNLSKGRVGISFASGWQPVDFVIRPENYAERHKIMYDGIETVRRLWRGETMSFPGVDGKPVEIRTLPRPIQPELPVWVTTAGAPETWRSAGQIGANVLTHLLGQSPEELAEKIRIYRDAWREAGHGPGDGHVTIMLHTFVADDLDFVRETVRKPMTDYLGSSLSLVKNVAASWTAFKKRSDGSTGAADIDLNGLSEEEMQDLLAYSFERYFETSGLFGTSDSCLPMVERLRANGIDEIACLIDFGIDSDTVLTHLEHLNRLRERAAALPAAVSTGERPVRDVSLGALIRDHGVTHLQCTPSMASMLMEDEDTRDALRSVTTLMIGGEAFPISLANALTASTPANVINMYGPTETTVWSSTQAVAAGMEPIPIGRPIANTEFYILDKSRQPAPIGVAGELYIGGDGVVRGYWERRELTAERFIPNPFNGRADRRLYRTGDVARFLPDGNTEFLGRVDHQVKIRGHRIELGEIETTINLDAAVREAVVIPREDKPGDQRLVAYLIAHEGKTISVDDLRRRLREALPEFMVPSHFVVMNAFPLTPNRKVDRKKLPAPHEVIADAPKAYVKPANDIEETIAGIWQEVLGIAQAGTEDNFFDLGGHSLLAVKAHRRLKEAFQRELAITDLFRFPTIRTLAQFLGNGTNGKSLQESQSRGETRRELMTQRRQARVRQRSRGS